MRLAQAPSSRLDIFHVLCDPVEGFLLRWADDDDAFRSCESAYTKAKLRVQHLLGQISCMGVYIIWGSFLKEASITIVIVCRGSVAGAPYCGYSHVDRLGIIVWLHGIEGNQRYVANGMLHDGSMLNLQMNIKSRCGNGLKCKWRLHCDKMGFIWRKVAEAWDVHTSPKAQGQSISSTGHFLYNCSLVGKTTKPMLCSTKTAGTQCTAKTSFKACRPTW